MKVKIIKAEYPTYWYADLIGQIFDVADDYISSTDYVLESDYNHPRRYDIGWRHIQKTDCEIFIPLSGNEESARRV